MRRASTVLSFSVMPGLVPGIHVLLWQLKKDVVGRDAPATTVLQG
jgi:hypothetical protein